MTTAGALGLAGMLSGCMVGPNYKTPKADIAGAWLPVSEGGSGVATDSVNAEWWKQFNDPVLESLVQQAVGQNLSLQTAGLRVLQARAARGIAVGQFFPQSQSAFGNIRDNQVSANSPAAASDRSFADADIGLQAAWELDFWGKFRRGIESSDAALLSTVADYDTVLISVISDVASRYIEIRSLQERLGLAKANAKLQADTVRLTEVRFRAGAVSELDVATARATLGNTQALIPQFEDGIRQATLLLCVLLGRTPSDLSAELGPERPVPQPPQTIALGIPADLLRRRPDVRSAEHIAAAASAQIGVAKADFYPAISINGSTGFASSNFDFFGGPQPQLNNIFDANSFAGFIGLSVSWPILNYGRIQNNVRVQDAIYQQAVTNYQNSVLVAAADVERGLSTFLRSRERSTFLAESVVASQRSADISLIQYRNGAVDFIRVNQAQTDLVAQQDALAASKAITALGAISTFRALGGGWEIRAGKEFVPQPTIDQMRERTDWGDLIAPSYSEGNDLMFSRPREDEGLGGPSGQPVSGERSAPQEPPQGAASPPQRN